MRGRVDVTDDGFSSSTLLQALTFSQFYMNGTLRKVIDIGKAKAYVAREI